MRKLLSSGRRALYVAGALAVVGAASTALAADHRDGAAVKQAANIAADINDVYAFMNNDKVVLGMTVFPAADDTSQFSDAVVYVIRVDSHSQFGAPATGGTDVRCVFDASQSAQCWIGEDEYVSGDISSPDGVTSASGRVKVFAGLRTDPFYFFLNGFNAARTTVQTAFSTIMLNANGCPQVQPATAGFLLSQLQATTPATDDFFASLNTLAIVVEADTDVFAQGTDTVLSVYASTHARTN